MATVSLLSAGNPLADPACQLTVLQRSTRQKSFEVSLAESGLFPFRAGGIDILQLNLGRLCNMSCQHCHVDAGPDRREVMTSAVAEMCMRAVARTDIRVLDLTGGAPEMNPNFRWLVERARALRRHVIDRCNLTILQSPGYDDLPEFLSHHQVEIVASLPCYLEANVNAQRGDHAFERSIAALRRLNHLGYGRPATGLELTLVYNPLGPTLPPTQSSLQEVYRRELARECDIQFNRLITITNMPISRFLDRLLATGKYDEYMTTLIAAYNPAAARGVMCRNTLSVDWQGRLYDCDFNQMLGLTVSSELSHNIRDFDLKSLADRFIVTGQHCYGCTAGAGSSCQGTLV